MALRSDLGVDKSLIWNTKIPNINKSRISSTFSLMGSEWCLRFVYCVGRLYHCIYLQRMKDGKILQEREALETTFCVRAYMMDITKHDDVEFESKRISVVETTECIWYSGYEKDAIFKKLTWLYDLPEVKFVCKFYGRPWSTFQLQTETDHLSPVVVQEFLRRTEDKSIQVSSGVPRDIGVQVSSEVPRDVESLSSDFSHLLQEEILPDVRLECGGRTFQAHRSVLGARSEVFRAMFQNKMLENKTGAVKVQDVAVGVLGKLLMFVYTGRPEDLCEDTTADLYEAADKYAVLSLKTACAYWIARNLTVENCVKYLRVSDTHSDHDLKAVVISFITENPIVMKSDSWLSLSKELPVLANEVLQFYITSTVQ